MVLQARTQLLEVDFLNNYAARHDQQYRIGVDPRYPDGDSRMRSPAWELTPSLKERFLEEVVGSVWHTKDTDELEIFISYDDGTYYCQRRKTKYSFDTNTTYHDSYHFKGATSEQSLELREKIFTFLEVQDVEKALRLEHKIKKVDEEYMFFEHTYLKRLDEKRTMLAVCDWRILPDITDSYAGEKNMWIKYREELRKLLVKGPDDYATPLAFFRDIKTLKWPIDPKVYFEKYPNGQDAGGNAVEYLKADDNTQWVERELDASKDVLTNKLINIDQLRQRYIDSTRVVKQEVQDMMKMIKIEEVIEGGVDYTTMYTEEEMNDLANP